MVLVALRDLCEYVIHHNAIFRRLKFAGFFHFTILNRTTIATGTKIAWLLVIGLSFSTNRMVERSFTSNLTVFLFYSLKKYDHRKWNQNEMVIGG